ncbi:MAG: hypothetical protein ACI4VQ_04295 [Clostridia bacterium]
MPFIEIITDAKSQAQLNKIIEKDIVNNCEVMYIREKNIENIKNIKLETIVLNQAIENVEAMNKIMFNAKNIILNIDLNENILEYNNIKTISFGYNSKSDITVSSVEDDEKLICIQNTIESIYGRKIEPQEIKVNVKADINIYNIMIIIALSALYAR